MSEKEEKLLTESENATYQALRARGYDHIHAYHTALDGVSVDQVREADNFKVV